MKTIVSFSNYRVLENYYSSGHKFQLEISNYKIVLISSDKNSNCKRYVFQGPD